MNTNQHDQPIKLAVDTDPRTPDSGHVRWIHVQPNTRLHGLFFDIPDLDYVEFKVGDRLTRYNRAD